MIKIKTKTETKAETEVSIYYGNISQNRGIKVDCVGVICQNNGTCLDRINDQTMNINCICSL